jgi:hypothetical protein
LREGDWRSVKGRGSALLEQQRPTTNMTVVQAQQAATTAAAAKEIPRGKPVSGRPWKTVQKTRFSTAKYTGTAKLSTTWEDKLAKKARAKELKALQGEIKARRQAERDAKRQAREDKEKRRKENELKSAAVQVVRPALSVMLVLLLVGTHVLLVCLADLADTPHQGHEQEAAAQHQEDHRQQAGRRRVRAALLQVAGGNSRGIARPWRWRPEDKYIDARALCFIVAPLSSSLSVGRMRLRRRQERAAALPTPLHCGRLPVRSARSRLPFDVFLARVCRLGRGWRLPSLWC